MFVSMPPAGARVGKRFEYVPCVTRSIGHLVAYTANNTPYNYEFRYGDTLAFSMPKGPAWLKLDAKTGRLSGIPSKSSSGTCEVHLLVKSDLGGADKQQFVLKLEE